MSDHRPEVAGPDNNVGPQGAVGPQGEQGPRGAGRGHWWRRAGLPYIALAAALVGSLALVRQEGSERTRALCEATDQTRDSARGRVDLLVRLLRQDPAVDPSEAPSRAELLRQYLTQTYADLPDLDCTRTNGGQPLKVPVPVPDVALLPPLVPLVPVPVAPPAAAPPAAQRRTTATTARPIAPAPVPTPPPTVAPAPVAPAPSQPQCRAISVLGACPLG